MTIALVGVGVMGEAVMAGLLDAGIAASEIVVVERRPERIDELSATYGVRCTSLLDAVPEASVIFLVVKQSLHNFQACIHKLSVSTTG